MDYVNTTTLKRMDSTNYNLLFKMLRSMPGTVNQTISPISILTSLCGVLLGADGETKKEIEDKMLSRLSVEQKAGIHEHMSCILDALQQSKTFTLSNTVCFHPDTRIKEDWLVNSQKHYQMQIQRENKKLGIIPHPDQFHLINEVHFQADWDKLVKFTPMWGRFQHQTTTMMYTEAWLLYNSQSMCDMVRIPYGSNESLYIFLPTQHHVTVKSMMKFLNNMSPKIMQNLIQEARKRKVALLLPPISSSSKLVSLKESLYHMGIKKAFQVGVANFKHLVDHQYCNIDRMLQSVNVNVNVDGTKADATTVIDMTVADGPNIPPPLPPTEPGVIRFIVDRPFVFSIVHEPTGSVLFGGTVVKL
jgi:serine protease inhibitor